MLANVYTFENEYLPLTNLPRNILLMCFEYICHANSELSAKTSYKDSVPNSSPSISTLRMCYDLL